MNTLYLWLPSAAALQAIHRESATPCRYIGVTPDGTVTCDETGTLEELPAIAETARQVIVLPAAADITLLQLTPPPLSANRLQQALPGLVEEHLLEDADTCILVTGSADKGTLPVAVMRGELLRSLAQRCPRLQGATLRIVPPQSLLPPEGNVFIVQEYAHAGGVFIELAGRTAAHAPLGLTLHAASMDSAASTALSTLDALLAGDAPAVLLVPPPRLSDYRALSRDGIEIEPDDGRLYARGVPHASVPDLATALPAQHRQRLQTWRRPLQLAAAVLLVNIVALNLDWWRLQQEADGLRHGMRATYAHSFPQEQVILDPLLQMQQKIDAARQTAGAVAPDDFLALTADLAAALRAPANTAVPAQLDYRERRLQVAFKNPQAITGENMNTMLAQQGLSAQMDGGNWRIGRQP